MPPKRYTNNLCAITLKRSIGTRCHITRRLQSSRASDISLYSGRCGAPRFSPWRLLLLPSADKCIFSSRVRDFSNLVCQRHNRLLAQLSIYRASLLTDEEQAGRKTARSDFDRAICRTPTGLSEQCTSNSGNSSCDVPRFGKGTPRNHPLR